MRKTRKRRTRRILLDLHSVNSVLNALIQDSAVMGPLSREYLLGFYKETLNTKTILPAIRAKARIDGLIAGGKWSEQDQKSFEQNNVVLWKDIQSLEECNDYK